MSCNPGQALGSGNSTSTSVPSQSSSNQAEQDPHRTTKQPNQQEFTDKQIPQRPLAYAEAAHRGTAVQMPARERCEAIAIATAASSAVSSETSVRK